MTSSKEALDRLRDGNRRFVSNLKADARPSESGPLELPREQQPFAIVLGCSDARVPPELVFDQGLGDLFVIRVVGNIVTPSQLESVEYGVLQLRARLVVVLGHTQCGAVKATLDELQQAPKSQVPKLRSIVPSVRSSIEPLLNSDCQHDRNALLRHAVRANVAASVNQLWSGSGELDRLVREQSLSIVGAEYSVETGVVEFLSDPDAF